MNNRPTTQQDRSRLRKKKRIAYDDDEEDLLLVMLLNSNAAASQLKERGSKNANLPRGYLEGNIRLMKDYFDTDCIYPENLFRRRFRMQRSLFLTIVNAVADHDNYL
jgi:hypothetical protein